MSTTTTTSPRINAPLPDPALSPLSSIPQPFRDQTHLPANDPFPPQHLLHAPACDSLQLRRTLHALHLQTTSMSHAARCVAKLAELTDSKKPEVARRACMTLLKLAHLDAAPNLIANSPNIFDEPDDDDLNTPSPLPPLNQKSLPPTFDIALAWTLPAPQPAPLHLARPVHRLTVGSSRVDLQACKLEYSIVSPK